MGQMTTAEKPLGGPKVHKVGQQRILLAEPYVNKTVLKACSKCGSVHPRARKPPILSDECPDCGTPATVVEVGESKAEIAGDGIWARMARGCLSWAEKLVNLSKGI